ncbi:hypothetical protein [Fibrobacter intestinalis]|uniref:hypothetical protein n=1 Tax=Fibrobacter sp. NR9 TaxID=1896200 RepID=UPI000BD875E4|nr:hypothetical protein [Fibrobacter sp. NR9]PBC74362.1 hypothetical protein BGW94_2010 [Fibrobacter sp. NR9]
MENDYAAYYTVLTLKKLGLSPEEIFSKKEDEQEKFMEKYGEKYREKFAEIFEERRTKDKKLYNLMFQNVADGSFFV